MPKIKAPQSIGLGPWFTKIHHSEDRGDTVSIVDSAGFPVIPPLNIPFENAELMARAPKMQIALGKIRAYADGKSGPCNTIWEMADEALRSQSDASDEQR